MHAVTVFPFLCSYTWHCTGVCPPKEGHLLSRLGGAYVLHSVCVCGGMCGSDLSEWLPHAHGVCRARHHAISEPPCNCATGVGRCSASLTSSEQCKKAACKHLRRQCWSLCLVGGVFWLSQCSVARQHAFMKAACIDQCQWLHRNCVSSMNRGNGRGVLGALTGWLCFAYASREKT